MSVKNSLEVSPPGLVLTSLRIVAQNVSMALVLEDDADWDLRLKSQLEAFTTAALGLGIALRRPHWHDFFPLYAT
jgi:hypothetical protein